MSKVTDNVELDFPARMNDGRQFTDYRPNCYLNNQLGQNTNTPSHLILSPNENTNILNFTNLKKNLDKFYDKNKSIDYLINTTGVLWFEQDVSVTNINFDTWDKVFEINLKSMGYLAKLIIPKMKKNKFGSMVHISSVDALAGDDKPQDAYGASKAAMIRLSKSLAIQFASKNIRSNCILPGAVETPMQNRWKKNPLIKKQLSKNIPLQRIGSPKDIANTILFLLSDEGGYITGTEIIVDGGITAKP